MSSDRAVEVLNAAAAIHRSRRIRQRSFSARLAFYYGLARFRHGMGPLAGLFHAWRMAR